MEVIANVYNAQICTSS